jgi:hypothetical protein
VCGRVSALVSEVRGLYRLDCSFCFHTLFCLSQCIQLMLYISTLHLLLTTMSETITRTLYFPPKVIYINCPTNIFRYCMYCNTFYFFETAHSIFNQIRQAHKAEADGGCGVLPVLFTDYTLHGADSEFKKSVLSKLVLLNDMFTLYHTVYVADSHQRVVKALEAEETSGGGGAGGGGGGKERGRLLNTRSSAR